MDKLQPHTQSSDFPTSKKGGSRAKNAISYMISQSPNFNFPIISQCWQALPVAQTVPVGVQPHPWKV